MKKITPTRIAFFGMITAVILIIFLAGCGSVTPNGTPRPTATPRNSVGILILTSDTKAEWVETVTESFNATEFKTSSGKTIFVEVVEQDSPGEARDAVLEGTIQPVVWSPGDMSWVEQANQVSRDLGKGPLVTEECPLIVYAATGFAMWQPMAEAMGWPEAPIGWDEIVDLATDTQGWGKYGHPEWGQFKFGHTHPEHSTTGFSLLANLAYASLDMTGGLTPELVKSEEVVKAFRNVELNTYHYGTSTRVLMNQMAERGPSYLHAVSASETAVLANNKYVPAPDDKLFPYVFIFPAEGTFWSDNPFCILDTDWVSEEQREAALVYKDYLLAPEQQDIAIDTGLRPANPDVPLHDPISLDSFTDPRVSPDTVPPLEGVSGETANAIVDVFNQTKKKATTLLVLDTSGSMSGDKIHLAREAVLSFLRQMDRDDEVMVYLFNHGVEVMQPLAMAGSVVESSSSNIRNIKSAGDTALYDAICQAKATAESAKTYDEAAGEERLYGIVLLSDGEDTASDFSEIEMFSKCLPESESADVVKIFTIAYGSEANKELLEQIAGRTNGRAFVADPENIDEVYLAISAEQ